jgi:two-component system, OmpR family, alkaline phosphatase synthesis response regulator PhoP
MRSASPADDRPLIRRPVLVVDDEPHIGRIISARLAQGPFDVTLVSSGRAACERLDRDEPLALMVLDLMMPEISGFDVLHVARQNPRWARLPCIVLTAMGQDSVAHGLATLGISEFMTKPFSPRRLYARALALTDAAFAPSPSSTDSASEWPR